MGPEFFQTQMGKTFYESTMKQLVKELKELNSRLSEETEQDVVFIDRLSECLSRGWKYVGTFKDRDSTYAVIERRKHGEDSCC